MEKVFSTSRFFSELKIDFISGTNYYAACTWHILTKIISPIQYSNTLYYTYIHTAFCNEYRRPLAPATEFSILKIIILFIHISSELCVYQVLFVCLFIFSCVCVFFSRSIGSKRKYNLVLLSPHNHTPLCGVVVMVMVMAVAALLCVSLMVVGCFTSIDPFKVYQKIIGQVRVLNVKTQLLVPRNECQSISKF